MSKWDHPTKFAVMSVEVGIAHEESKSTHLPSLALYRCSNSTHFHLPHKLGSDCDDSGGFVEDISFYSSVDMLAVR
jgi:hypothetical protein